MHDAMHRDGAPSLCDAPAVHVAGSATCMLRAQHHRCHDAWVGSRVCAPPWSRHSRGLGLGTIVDLDASGAVIEVDGRRKLRQHLNFSSIIVMSRPNHTEITRRSNATCWHAPEHLHLDPLSEAAGRHPTRLNALQREMSHMIYTSTWNGPRWTPSAARHWNSTLDAGIFAKTSVAVLGASPMRQLVNHFQLMLAGVFDRGHIHEPRSIYRSCLQPLGQSMYAKQYPTATSVYGQRHATTATCELHPCGPQSMGFGCSTCVCCCGCEKKRLCSTQDFTVRTNSSAGGGADATITFSDKPELYHTTDDKSAMTSRFCRSPPDLLVVQKGIHDSFFDVYTALPPQFNFERNRNEVNEACSQDSNPLLPRVSLHLSLRDLSCHARRPISDPTSGCLPRNSAPPRA